MAELRQLLAKMEEEIAKAQERYQADQEDSYLSHVRAAEIEALQALRQRLRRGESMEELSAWIRQELSRLEENMEQELNRPSFDWYDEHYQYKRLEGRRDAYKIAVGIIEEALS